MALKWWWVYSLPSPPKKMVNLRATLDWKMMQFDLPMYFVQKSGKKNCQLDGCLHWRWQLVDGHNSCLSFGKVIKQPANCIFKAIIFVWFITSSLKYPQIIPNLEMYHWPKTNVSDFTKNFLSIKNPTQKSVPSIDVKWDSLPPKTAQLVLVKMC